MILGIDVSTYFEEEAVGAKYFSNGKKIDPLKEFFQQNVEYMRIRVWNNPYAENGKPYLAGTCDLANYIKLGKLAKSYGYHIVLDIHYSDFWADPNKQYLPKAWENLSFEEIKQKVYDFTKECLVKSKEAGIPIDYIQIGNEITNGMLWPYGKLDCSTNPRGNYENLATFLRQGIQAVKDYSPETKIIIHLERSFDQGVYDEFFTHMNKLGVKYDVIGMSYYPYWHHGFDEFFTNVEMCKNKFHKEIMIMEVSYAFTLKDYLSLKEDEPRQLVINDKNYVDFTQYLSYPLTIEGQASFINKLIKLSKIHGISGIFYWEPLWIPHGKDICWSSPESQKYIKEENKSTRNEWSNQCLFDYEGNELPGFRAFSLK